MPPLLLAFERPQNNIHPLKPDVRHAADAQIQ